MEIKDYGHVVMLTDVITSCSDSVLAPNRSRSEWDLIKELFSHFGFYRQFFDSSVSIFYLNGV